MKSAFLFLCGSLLPVAAWADLSAVAADADARLQGSLEELSTLRAQIAKEKLPMAAELRKLEDELFTKRSERDRLQRLRDNADVQLSAAETRLKAHEDELAYLANLLGDYATRFNASLHPSEVDAYADAILPILNVADNASLDTETKLLTRFDAILLGLERLEENAGGRIFEGAAVLPDGGFEEGKFALLGPIALFSNDSGQVAGLAERSTSSKARVLVFDPAATAPIATFVQAGGGEIPLDPTLGRATAIAATRESLVDHIKKGGLWMFPILGFAALSLLVGLIKFIEISQFKTLTSKPVFEALTLIEKGDKQGAEHLARGLPGAAGTMLTQAVKYADVPKELIDELLFETILEFKPKLERGLAFISVTAAVAPLLGLLGTVTGMINTFKLITLFGTGDAKSLSSGISEALITTEFGLVVAIPSLLLSAFLSRKAAGLIAKMEKSAISFVNGITVIKERGVAIPVTTAASN